jgi:hypothetical protein
LNSHEGGEKESFQRDVEFTAMNIEDLPVIDACEAEGALKPQGAERRLAGLRGTAIAVTVDKMTEDMCMITHCEC